MKKKIQFLVAIVILLCLITTSDIFAQVGLKNLYFNSFTDVVRLDLSGDEPVVELTGVAGSYEGVAHYEDSQGGLLFWFNANGVYNANNEFMTGSTGIFANSSAAEMVMCPVPGDSDRFYFIYNQETCTPLYYSVIDMTLNDGLGDVTNLNTLIDSNTFSEGMEIVRIPNTNDYWLLGYNCDVGITRFLIDESGIGEGEVIYELPMPPGTYDGRGELDYHRGRIGASFAWATGDAVFAADFDPANGDICNAFTLSDSGFASNCFGVDFSLDGSKMYITLWYYTSGPNVFQYDFDTGEYQGFTAPLGGSGFISGLGEIELGRDGRLYIIQDGGSNIVAINNANSLEPEFETIPIPNGVTTGLGISDQIQSIYDDWESNVYQESFCAELGSNITLVPETAGEFAWISIAAPLDTIAVAPSLEITVTEEPATYFGLASSEVNCSFLVQQQQFSIVAAPEVDAGDDITINQGEEVELNPTINVPEATVIWFPADGLSDPFSANPIASPEETTTYFLTVQNGPCQSNDQITVNVEGVGINDIIEDAGVSVYPNPFTDFVSINTGNLRGEAATFRIYDASGRIMVNNVYDINSQSQIDINLQGLPNAVYYLEISTNEGRLIEKIVKTN